MKGCKYTVARSSNVAGWSYRVHDRTLEVRFVPSPGRPPAVYLYSNVPPSVVEELEAINAARIAGDETASVGSAFNRLVKRGGYAYRRVGGYAA